MCPKRIRGAVVALGNFDGLHRGHQHVIATARDIARADGRKFGLLTFEPHPRTFFGKETEPFRLTPFRIKVREFQALGAEQLFVLRFHDPIATHGRQFLTNILHKGIAPPMWSSAIISLERAGTANPISEARANELGFKATSVRQPATK